MNASNAQAGATSFELLATYITLPCFLWLYVALPVTAVWVAIVGETPQPAMQPAASIASSVLAVVETPVDPARTVTVPIFASCGHSP
jgi:hypothetical protein